MVFICKTLELNRSSYYAWLKRPAPKREKKKFLLIEKIKSIHHESKGTYGAPRITMKLRSEGQVCNRKRVANLMRKEGIFGCAKRKYRGMSGTDSKHSLPVAPRVFEVQTKVNFPSAPNRVWVSDTTYIATLEGWIYLTIQLDVFTRKIVGYTVDDNLRAEAVWESMRLAIMQQEGALSLSEPNLIAHSDRGVQYASDLYRGNLKDLGMTQSMSRKGNCYDNAYAETFFHSLKVELIHRHEFRTRAEAELAIREYIEEWYNSKRLHSGLGYLAPIDYERQALAA